MENRQLADAQAQIDSQADTEDRFEWLVRYIADLLVAKQYDDIDTYIRQCPELINVPIYEYVFEVCDDRVLVQSFCQNPESSAVELATGFIEYISEASLWLI